MKTVTSIPEWLTLAAKDAMLTASEIAPIFGLNSPSQLARQSHSFPPPDKHEIRVSGRYMRKRCYWKVSTIIAEIKRRNQLEALHNTYKGKP